jgi:hypothetical protein
MRLQISFHFRSPIAAALSVDPTISVTSRRTRSVVGLFRAPVRVPLSPSFEPMYSVKRDRRPFLFSSRVANESDAGSTAESIKQSQGFKARIEALVPSLEACVAIGLKTFDAPGLAIGIVSGDRLVYAKGFGVSSKNGGARVDTHTVLTNKGFSCRHQWPSQLIAAGFTGTTGSSIFIPIFTALSFTPRGTNRRAPTDARILIRLW